MAPPDASPLKLLLEPARSLVLLLPRSPSFDLVASALALKLGLEEVVGHNLSLCAPEPMTVEYSRLVGVDTIQNSFGSRNLVISFGPQTEAVDKVSYNLDHGELQLVVSPKASSPDLDPRRLSFVSSAGQADTYLLIGVSRLDDLGSFTSAAAPLLKSAHSVAITLQPADPGLATLNFTDSTASCLSELTTRIFTDLQIPISADVASNLLSGLQSATQNFQSPAVTASTFEAAALLMRRQPQRSLPLSAADFPPGSIPQSPPSPTVTGFGTDHHEIPPSPPAATSPSPDWYEPKIYQGHTLP